MTLHFNHHEAFYLMFFFYIGNVRNVSPILWQFEHLTALYLNDNNLLRLPNDIGNLINLRSLDISSNKLRSLPAELGELIHLRYYKTLLQILIELFFNKMYLYFAENYC